MLQQMSGKTKENNLETSPPKVPKPIKKKIGDLTDQEKQEILEKGLSNLPSWATKHLYYNVKKQKEKEENLAPSEKQGEGSEKQKEGSEKQGEESEKQEENYSPSAKTSEENSPSLTMFKIDNLIEFIDYSIDKDEKDTVKMLEYILDKVNSIKSDLE